MVKYAPDTSYPHSPNHPFDSFKPSSRENPHAFIISQGESRCASPFCILSSRRVSFPNERSRRRRKDPVEDSPREEHRETPLHRSLYALHRPVSRGSTIFSSAPPVSFPQTLGFSSQDWKKRGDFTAK